MSELGAANTQAWCAAYPTGQTRFPYPPIAGTVSTFRRLHVTPATGVHPGTVLTVTETGGCPKGGPTAVLQPPGRPMLDPSQPGTVGVADFVPDASGHWHGQVQVQVSPRAGPGSYLVDVFCFGPGREYDAYYPLVGFTVTAS